MRTRLFSLLAMAALLLAAGCERSDVAVFMVEGDEPGFRRGMDLKRQDRKQEALAEFLKVIEKRGLNNAPESHLEVGLLYQFHLKNPIAAIYHYQKFRELKPNSPQAELVRQRIDAATRDFARGLLGNPLEKDLDRLTSDELAKRLQRENDLLKVEIASLRAGKIVASRDDATAAGEEGAPVRPSPVAASEVSPVSRTADAEAAPVTAAAAPVLPPIQNPMARPVAPTTRPGTTNVQQTRPATQSGTTARPTTGSYRRHVVVKGDTLYSLAQRYYGNRSRWRDIYAANRDVMRSPDDYKVGLELKIPQ